MTGADFDAWRARHKLSASAAARALGCTKNTALAWAKRERLPRYVALACAAYSYGLKPMGEE